MAPRRRENCKVQREGVSSMFSGNDIFGKALARTRFPNRTYCHLYQILPKTQRFWRFGTAGFSRGEGANARPKNGAAGAS